LSAKLIGKGEQPLICTPLVAPTKDLILTELNNILEKKPDIIEWRADFFDNIHDKDQVIALAKQIADKTGETPVIFTLRSSSEGGNRIPGFAGEAAFELIAAVAGNTGVEYVDYELSNPPEQIKKLREITAAHNTKIIASFHDFTLTPDKETLFKKLVEAKQYGADVAKVAVMPNSLADVLSLLEVTLEAKNTLAIPVITVSMGSCGVASRLLGGVFGSAVTFAVGKESSAPGQIPIDEMKTVLDVIHKSVGKRKLA
jgi:3-dehydroquinate dehydratase-1